VVERGEGEEGIEDGFIYSPEALQGRLAPETPKFKDMTNDMVGH